MAEPNDPWGLLEDDTQVDGNTAQGEDPWGLLEQEAPASGAMPDDWGLMASDPEPMPGPAADPAVPEFFQQNLDFEDQPLAENFEQAKALAAEAQGLTLNMPESRKRSLEIVGQADGLEVIKRLGLAGVDKELERDILKAMTYKRMVNGADPAAEEIMPAMKLGARNLLRVMQNTIAQGIQTNLALADNALQRGDQAESDRIRSTTLLDLQNDLEAIELLQPTVELPHGIAAATGAMMYASDRRRNRLAGDNLANHIAESQGGVVEALVDGVHSELPGGLYSYTDNPVFESFQALVDKHFMHRNEDGAINHDLTDRKMVGVFTDTLSEYRAQRAGVASPKSLEDPVASLASSHPQLMQRALNESIYLQQKGIVLDHGPASEDVLAEIRDKTDAYLKEHGATFLENIQAGGLDAIEAAQRGLAWTDSTRASEIADNFGRLIMDPLSQLGTVWHHAARKGGQVLGSAMSTALAAPVLMAEALGMSEGLDELIDNQVGETGVSFSEVVLKNAAGLPMFGLAGSNPEQRAAIAAPDGDLLSTLRMFYAGEILDEELLKYEHLGLDPSLIREQWQGRTFEQAIEDWQGDRDYDKEIDEADAESRRILGEYGRDFLSLDGAKAYWKPLVLRGQRLVRDFYGQLYSDPNQALGGLTAEALASAAGIPVVKMIGTSPAGRMMMHGSRVRRANTVIPEAIMHAPDLLAESVDMLRRTTRGSSATPGINAYMNAAESVLADLRPGAVANPYDLRRNPQLQGKIESVRSVIRHMSSDDMDTMLSTWGVDGRLRQYLDNPTMTEALLEGVTGFKFGNFRARRLVKKTAASSQAEGALAHIRLHGIETDMDGVLMAPEDFSPRNLSWYDRVLGRFNPRAQRFKAQGSAGLVLRALESARADGALMAASQAKTRASAQSLFNFLEGKARNNKRAALTAMQIDGPDAPALREMVDTSDLQVQQIQNLRDITGRANWEEGLDLRDLPISEAEDFVDLIDLQAHAATQVGRHGIWMRLREVGESLDDFEERLASVNNRRDLDPDSEEFAALSQEARRMKRTLLKEVYSYEGMTVEAPGGGTAINPRLSTFFTDSGDWVTERQVRRKIKEDGGNPDEVIGSMDAEQRLQQYGFRYNPHFKETWGEVFRMADAEIKARSRVDKTRLFGRSLNEDALEHFNGMRGGTVRDTVIYARNVIASGRMTLAGTEIKAKNQMKWLAGLTEEKRAVVNQIIAKRADGGPMDDFNKLYDDPDLGPDMKHHFPRDADEGLMAFFENHDDMVYQLLDLKVQAGLLDPAKVQDMLHFQRRRYDAFERPLERPAEVRGERELERLDNERDVNAQRHHSKWRVIVTDRGAPLRRHLFPDEETALTWVRENVGEIEFSPREDTLSGKYHGVAKVGGRQTVSLVEPLDDVAREALGEYDAAESAVRAVRADAISAVRAISFGALDKPGMAWTPEQFAALPSSMQRHMFQMPDNPKFGTLRNKYITSSVARTIADWESGSELSESIWRATEGAVTAGEAISTVFDYLGRAPGFSHVAKFNKSMVQRAQVAASISTNLLNYYGDLLFFAVPAVGWGVFKHLDEAKNIMASLKYGKARFRDLPDDLGEVFDESFFGRSASEFDDISRFGEKANEGVRDWLRNTGRIMLGKEDSRIRKVTKQLEDAERRYQLAKDNNLDKIASQIGREMASIHREFGKAFNVETDGMASGAVRQAMSQLKFHAKRFGRADPGTLSRRLMDRYADLSNTVRLATYLRARDRFGHAHAVEIVRNQMQTYSRVPTLVRNAQHVPAVSPFLSFTYEANRIMMHQIKHHPGKVLGMAATMPVLNTLSVASSGIDPDEAWNAQARFAQGSWWRMAHQFAPMISTGDGGVFSGYAPLNPRDTLGMAMYDTNIGRGIKDRAAGEATAGLDGFLADVYGSTLNGPAVSLVQRLADGENQFTGERNWGALQSLGGWAKDTMTAYVPQFTPYFGTWANDIHSVADGKARGLSRQEKTLFQSMAQNIARIRLVQGTEGDLPGVELLSPAARIWGAIFGADARSVNLPDDRVFDSEGMTEEDFASAVVLSLYDVNADDLDIEVGPSIDDRALRIYEGMRDTDPERAEELLAEIADRQERNQRARRENAISLVKRGYNKEEMLEHLRRIEGGGDFYERFDQLSLVHKLQTVVVMSEFSNVSEDFLGRLERSMRRSPSGGMARPSLIQAEDAAAMLEQAIQFSAGDRRQRFERLRGTVRSQVTLARVNRMRQAAMDKRYREAAETYDRMKDSQGE